MNKKIILPFVAILVLAVAMVGAASADEVTTVDTVEIRGDVLDLIGPQGPTEIWWDATWFAAFWYDLDDNLMTERLWINESTIDGTIGGARDRTIEEDKLFYNTSPVAQEYELSEAGLKLEIGVDNRTHYFIEGWMAEKYVAINGQADKLCKLLVEFEGDDKKTLSTGESWDLGSGFTLTAQQIDLEGDKVWLSLEKNGKELDSEVITTGGDKNDSVYTYTVDLAGEDDIPVFHCYIDAVFRGTDSNIVQVKYVFLIDDDVLEIETGDEFGIMEATATSAVIELRNKEDALTLSKDSTEHIMGNMYFKIADTDDSIRFYPFVEYTEPGTYEIRGDVLDLIGPQAPTEIWWDAYYFAAFWYDLDDDLMTERLWINESTIDGTIGGARDRTIEEDKLFYNTSPVAQEYELSEAGLKLEIGVDNRTHYFIEGWMAEKYVAINGQADKLCKLLVEFEGDDKKTLSTGESWDLGSGFTLTAQQIDLEGDKVWLSLEKNGKELDSEVITTGGDKNDSVYTYTVDLAGEDDIPVFHCYIDAVFRGTDSNIVQVKYVFLIDDDVLEIETGDEFGIMEATATSAVIELRNKEDALTLSKDSTEHIMGNMYFKTADEDANDNIRFYPFVEYTIGEAPGEAEEEVETPIDANETADVNVTPTAVVTPTPEEAASPVVTATAEDTTAAEETATDKKTPGFEAVFAIAGLLAVAYLVLRQRE